MATNGNKCQNIVSQIEGLEWHIWKLKSYKITDKSCSPQYILKCILEEETELKRLKNELADTNLSSVTDGR